MVKWLVEVLDTHSVPVFPSIPFQSLTRGYHAAGQFCFNIESPIVGYLLNCLAQNNLIYIIIIATRSDISTVTI